MKLCNPHPAATETVVVPNNACGFPGGRGLRYGWQGYEKRLRILQILMDTLWNEPCPGVRFSIVGAVYGLEDVATFVDFYKRAYEKEDWAIPEGYIGAGDSPVRKMIVTRMAKLAVETRQSEWLDALRWLQQQETPWTQSWYFVEVAQAWEKLGLIDRSFIEEQLLPFVRPELGGGQFPVGLDWARILLRNARNCYSAEEEGALYLQVATTTTAVACQKKIYDDGLLSHIMGRAWELPTAHETYSVLLAHPSPHVRAEVAATIEQRCLKNLVDLLVDAYAGEAERGVCEAMRKAIEKLRPDSLASLTEKNFPPEPDILHTYDELLRRGEIDYETWAELRKREEEDRARDENEGR